jgi:hypothetical protein
VLLIVGVLLALVPRLLACPVAGVALWFEVRCCTGYRPLCGG